MTEPNFASIAQEFLADNESFYSRYNDVGAKLSALVEPRYGIFQLKGGEELRDYRFESAERLKKNGLYIDRENYDRVYRGRLREGETLDDIYQRFNIDHPADFRGHSLSVSDIICVKSNGTTAAYYVDSVGFTRVPDFTLDREERKARRTLTDNLTLIAENQLASDEMDDLGNKLFNYDDAPKYSGNAPWTMGAGLHADDFESLTARYHNGEDIRAELAQKIYGITNHISFYEYPPSDGIGQIEISSEITDSGMTFRTKGGFEITHSWKTLGEALITAARQEFDRHEELDRRYREQEEKAKAAEEAPYVTVSPFSKVNFSEIGLDSDKHYSIPEFIEAYANAEKLYTADESNSMRVDTITITLHIGNEEHHYRPMLGAEYGTLSAIMEDISLTNASNISVTEQTKALVLEIENNAQKTEIEETHDAPTAVPDEVIPEAAAEDESEDFEEIPETELYDYHDEPVQLNLFGEPMEEEKPEKTIIGGVDIEEALKYELIHYGTGFQDGKFRVEQFYREHPHDTKEFAKFLSKEYGIGGHTCEGKVDMSWHDGKGIKLDFKLDNGEKTSVTWNWQKVAARLATLIENQTYITQKDIDDRIRYAQNEVARYEPDTVEYQRSMKILEEYGLLENPREELAPDISTEEEKTAPDATHKSETAEPTAEITEIKNLAQLKRALVVGAEFEITSAYRPEVVNQLRRVNYADTTGIYSIRPDAPDDRVTLANDGRGSYLAWGKSSDWVFADGLCTCYQKDREHTPENVVFTIKVNQRVLKKEHTETQTAEQEEAPPKLNDIVIDLTARPERVETPVERHDYTITDENLGVGGAKTKFATNIAAIKTLKAIESENRLATPDEQAVLAQYVGWGGLAQAFDGNNNSWASEYKQLRELLTDEEYTAAKGSVLNAHYTTPTVINAIYKGLENLGFEGGNILEPAMGVGNFFGTMPETMRQNSHLHGVELNSISGRIARQLYQTADIQIKGYEQTEFSDNFFDAAVGNVPFGSYGVSDKRYNRENFFIHDYFLAKTLDKLAPGGVAALITTKGTLDKENPRVREYLARRGDLIGAIRLPNNAFKANAGTEVTTDILFFQKREKMAVEMPDWCYVGRNSEGVPVNNYFIDHPEMILGEMKQGMEYSLYGNANETACVPIEGADLKEQLEKAVGNLKLANAIRKHTEQRDKQAGIIPATADVRNFTFAEVDGKMYFRENNIMTEVTETGKRLDRIKALNELRKTFREILTEQENNCSDERLAE